MRAVVLALLGVAACRGSTRIDARVCLDPPPERTGEATYYDADGSGACSFAAGPDVMVAAMNGADYDTAAWCGGCVEVDGPAGTVVVRIVDSCPGCASGDLDLGRDAFAAIADVSAGRVPITWREVACDVTGPIRYHFKDGSNPFWTAIQIRNHRYPVTAVEGRLADGTWRVLVRQTYNYFVDADGLGAGPYTLRVADDRGHVVEDSGIVFAASTEVDGRSQFASCE